VLLMLQHSDELTFFYKGMHNISEYWVYELIFRDI
jgi:hypothetical protein